MVADLENRMIPIGVGISTNIEAPSIVDSEKGSPILKLITETEQTAEQLNRPGFPYGLGLLTSANTRPTWLGRRPAKSR